MSAQRPLRLRPWLISAVLPPKRIGTYRLHRYGCVVYVGRSDTDLRRRLIQHADANRADFFTYDVHWTSEQAYVMECALFHNAFGEAKNKIHPATPAHQALSCPFCLGLTGARLDLTTPRPLTLDDGPGPPSAQR